MPRFVRSDSSPPPGHLARHAARLDRCWPLVHVESVQIAPGAAGDCVSAVVQLGGLTPADVRVELMPTGAAAGTSGVADDERRMFSCRMATPQRRTSG